jgi:hypothetical protein
MGWVRDDQARDDLGGSSPLPSGDVLLVEASPTPGVPHDDQAWTSTRSRVSATRPPTAARAMRNWSGGACAGRVHRLLGATNFARRFMP